MKQRIYIDTSIVGGFFDKEFEKPTKALFEKLKRKEVVFVISNVLEKELLKAPSQVKDLLLQYEDCELEKAELNQESESLANAYIKEKVVGATSLEDCQHIAIATVSKVESKWAILRLKLETQGS